MSEANNDEPMFLFRGFDIVNLLTYWWQLARIFDVLQSMPDRERDEDPMESEDAMKKLRQEMADHLMSLMRRPDETTAFEEAPIVFSKNREAKQ